MPTVISEIADSKWMPAPEDFQVTEKHDAYTTLYDGWLLNLSIAEPHDYLLKKGENLDEFGSDASQAESRGQWNLRKTMSVDISVCPDLIDLRISNLFRRSPRRVYDKKGKWAKLIKRLINNADNAGTSLNDFMMLAMREHYVNGVEIFVDKMSSDVVPENLEQQLSLNLWPYFQLFTPLRRYDWGSGPNNTLLWARYNLGEEPRQTELGGGGTYTRFLTVEKNRWRLYRIPDTAESAGAWAATAQYTEGVINTGGRLPIVPLWFGQSVLPNLPCCPLSLLTRMSPVARYLINLVSQIQIDIYRSIGFFVATGVNADEIPGAITAMGCWVFSDPEAKLVDMAGDVGHVAQKLAFARELQTALLRMGKLLGGMGQAESSYASGVKVALVRTDLDNELRRTATQFEEAEVKMFQMAASRMSGHWVNRDELGYHVEYTKQYIRSDVSSLIERAYKFFKIPGLAAELSEEGKILLRQLLDAITTEDDPAYKKAMEQIEAANFLIASAAPGDGADDRESQPEAGEIHVDETRPPA